MRTRTPPFFLALFFGTILAVMLSSSTLNTVLAKEDYVFEGVGRIVAVGDLHGDFAAYAEIMAMAGLRDVEGNWTGGETHLVQTGDITDRGPDSKKIYDDLFRLAKQAKKAGGRVHLLIGNHEMMNMMGDLRYVDAGEFAAFETKSSDRKLKAFFDQLAARGFFQKELEEEELEKDEVYQDWLETHPPGFVEHREAWAAGGPYYKKVLSLPSLIKINDTLFTHAGIAPEYVHLSVEDFNKLVEDAITTNDQAAFDLLFSENGPLWYRGLALAGPEEKDHVLALLENFGAGRIVVGHTPTGGVVLPRFEGAVIVNDVGIGAYYGGARGFLLFQDGGWYGVHWGEKIPLPDPGRANLVCYLKKVAALSPAPKMIDALIAELENPLPDEAVN